MAAAGAANASKQFVTTSLFIGDLDPEVDENLYDLFDQVGQLVSNKSDPLDFYAEGREEKMLSPQMEAFGLGSDLNIR
ncbi:hypothetical protein AHAS_Ahas05G0087300 [Arachis hypogaea]|nr:polyadenylate-binding protein 8-like [Arachis hypogaea]